MLASYVPILIMLILAVGLSILLTLASRYLGPRRPTAAKLAPYECGIVPESQARQRFPIKFYLMAMLFIVFDIEAIFLYPWAVNLRYFKSVGQGGFGLAEMFTFIGVLLLGLVYIWKKGALEWE